MSDLRIFPVSAATLLCLTLSPLAQAGQVVTAGKPTLRVEGDSAVSLNWQKWQRTGEDWQFSTQGARHGNQLPTGAHLHLTADSSTGKTVSR